MFRQSRLGRVGAVGWTLDLLLLLILLLLLLLLLQLWPILLSRARCSHCMAGGQPVYGLLTLVQVCSAPPWHDHVGRLRAEAAARGRGSHVLRRVLQHLGCERLDHPLRGLRMRDRVVAEQHPMAGLRRGLVLHLERAQKQTESLRALTANALTTLFARFAHTL